MVVNGGREGVHAPFSDGPWERVCRPKPCVRSGDEARRYASMLHMGIAICPGRNYMKNPAINNRGMV